MKRCKKQGREVRNLNLRIHNASKLACSQLNVNEFEAEDECPSSEN